MTANVHNQHKKSPICGETCSDLTQPCYQAFLSLNVNIEIILDWVKICPELLIILCGLSILYYSKGRNFNSIWCVKKRENSDRKNSYFFNLCSAAFTMINFFTLVIAPQSISGQCFNYGKTALPKWYIGLKWIKHIPKENHHSKTWLFFL